MGFFGMIRFVLGIFGATFSAVTLGLVAVALGIVLMTLTLTLNAGAFGVAAWSRRFTG